MTTSRIVRGTKGRIFVYVCAILIVTGIIACYNNTRVELENVQKSNDLCHQQQESLSTQLQVISDYKRQLEKSLKTEKAEHQHSKSELETRLNEEKLKHQKITEETTLKFNSLQQHYNLLQTQHDDFKAECSNKHREQLDIINNYQAKLNALEGKLKQSEREKQNSLDLLQSRIEQLRTEKTNLEHQVKEISKREDVHKQSVKTQHKEYQEALQAPNISDTEAVKPGFGKQILIENSEYKISANNVAEQPPNTGDEPKGAGQEENMGKPDNMNQIVLPPPQKAQSSTPNSNMKSSKASMDQVQPLKLPTQTPESPLNKTSERTSNNNNPEPIPSPSKKLPDGVVAIQNLPEEENEPEASMINNRYRNVAEDTKDKETFIDDKAVDAQDRENGANEIFDVGGFNNEQNVGKPDEQKNRIDVDYDHFQNDPNLDENEDDDADYGNHNIPKDIAIRN